MQMKLRAHGFLVLLSSSMIVSTTVSLPGLANQNSYLKKGISKYNAGDYSEARAMFGAAEVYEFNNPVLHYYLADTYIKQNCKADAIREYQIALALQPTGTIADYCKRALTSLGISPSDKAKPVKPMDK